jgi:3-dehydroquinate dehydratase-2
VQPTHGAAPSPASATLREGDPPAAHLAPKVWCISGPNLGRLGTREPAVYGTTTLAEIHASLEALGRARGVEVVCAQSEHEGELISLLHRAHDAGALGVLLNAGGYTHTSVALLDAVRSVAPPVVEVHLSLPEAREAFRRRSLVGRACVAKVAGFGAHSYSLALLGLLQRVVGPAQREGSNADDLG